MSHGVVLYRGSLKGCNYDCSYCPFSKHRIGQKELQRDRQAWLRFVESVVKTEVSDDYQGFMVTPYGEALIYPWYWEGMAALSREEKTEVVGAQTNLSFALKESLDYFEKSGGKLEKLRLWATFHPEMISPENFARKCIQVWKFGITVCAGAVGKPENLALVQKLRSLLPQEIYLWINKMDGLGRDYTEAEKASFLEIDPYFWQELIPVLADGRQCRERLFVESDGRQRSCNIGRVIEGNWYDKKTVPKKEADGGAGFWHCTRKFCSCYLAYGGRSDFINQVLFGPYPVFRIPRRPRAVFLDIMGTLIPEENMTEKRKGQKEPEISVRTKLAVQTLAREGAKLFWATTLPIREAKSCCREIGQYFSGGVFAGGAHILADQAGQRREYFYRLECGWLSRLEDLKSKFGFRILEYRDKEIRYKLTLLRPEGRDWSGQEAVQVMEALEPQYRGKVRWILEGRCLQLVAKEATKENGVRMICEWLGIALFEIAAAGDSPEDQAMMGLQI